MNAKIRDGEVSSLHHCEEEIWVILDEYPGFEISSFGNLRFKRGVFCEDIVPTPLTTSVGFYLYPPRLKDKSGISRLQGLHRLTCMAFHGSPPNENSVVNHTDGDKTNNHYLNLEWSTQSDNCIHAMKEGMREDNVPVLATNKRTNEEILFYSIIEGSRYFNVQRHNFYRYIGLSKELPFRGEWVFDVEEHNFGRVSRPSSRTVTVYDPSKGLWLQTVSANMMTALTGISPATIIYLLKGIKVKLYGGFVFAPLGLMDSIPTFKQEEVLLSREKLLKRRSAVNRGLYIYDPITKTEEYFKRRKHLVEAYKEFDLIKLYGLMRSQREAGRLILSKGYFIKEDDDDRPWPVVNQWAVEVSKRKMKPNTNVFRITDTSGDDDKVVYGYKHLASLLDISLGKAMTVGDITYQKDYKIERIH